MDMETLKRYEHYRENWKEYLIEIKSVVLNLCPNAKVDVFGSIIKGNMHLTSDIVVLLVADEFKNVRRRIEIHSNLRLLFPDAPFEFRLIHPEKFPFYRKMQRRW